MIKITALLFLILNYVQVIVCSQQSIDKALSQCNSGNHAQALQTLKEIIEKNPESYNARFFLGLEYFHVKDLDNAIQCYELLTRIYPQYASSWFNLGFLKRQCAQYVEAFTCYKKAIELEPNNDKFQFGASNIFLLLGDYEQGLESFEKGRPESTHVPKRLHSLDNIAGKTIMLIEEWGIGDTFQFIRYAVLLKKLGANLALCARKNTQQLLSLCPYITHMLSFNEPIPFHVDYQITLPSLMYLFKTRIDSIPTPLPYLFADNKLKIFWKTKINPNTINVGINWKGSGTEKDIPAALLNIFCTIPNVTFYSLQKNGADDLKHNNLSFIQQFEPEFDREYGDFMDTSALMQHLDLIITMDTSIAHLAGALGRPTWVLLPYIADWRWMHNTTSSLWYPTMTLFRQSQSKDWNSVLEEVKNKLLIFIKEISYEKKHKIFNQ